MCIERIGWITTETTDKVNTFYERHNTSCIMLGKRDVLNIRTDQQTINFKNGIYKLLWGKHIIHLLKKTPTEWPFHTGNTGSTGIYWILVLYWKIYWKMAFFTGKLLGFYFFNMFHSLVTFTYSNLMQGFWFFHCYQHFLVLSVASFFDSFFFFIW